MTFEIAIAPSPNLSSLLKMFKRENLQAKYTTTFNENQVARMCFQKTYQI